MSNVMNNKRLLTAVLMATLISGPAFGQDGRRKGSSEKNSSPSNSDVNTQMHKVQEDAKTLFSNWSSEVPIIQDAHRIVWEQNGWDSEPDQFALETINQISGVPVWDTQAREQKFLDAYQVRYGLTADQTELIKNGMREKSIAFSKKHFAELMPIAMEAISTRAKGEPFTAEMVQRWANKLDPLMDEALGIVKAVAQDLEATMTPNQKTILNRDMEAVERRHNSVKEMMQEWKQGNWTALDFGLDHDPIHQEQIRKLLNERQEQQEAKEQETYEKEEKFHTVSKDPTEWEKYVIWFVKEYDCDDEQRIAADGILKRYQKEAMNYLASKADDIAEVEKKLKSTSNGDERNKLQDRHDKLMFHVERKFDYLKRALEMKLNSKQRVKLRENKLAEKKPASGKSKSASDGKTAKR